MTDLRLIEGGKGGGNPPPALPSPAVLSTLQQSIASLPEFPPIPAPNTDGDTAILMWEKRFKAIVQYINHEKHDESDEFGDYLADLENACYEQIAELPASTPAALAVKVRQIEEGISWGATRWDEICVRTLLADLDRMAKIGGAA